MEYQKYKDFFVVPEQLIFLCANQIDDEISTGENNFRVCLKYGDEFRMAGLTPIYLCKEDMKDVFVTTLEKMKNLFH